MYGRTLFIVVRLIMMNRFRSYIDSVIQLQAAGSILLLIHASNISSKRTAGVRNSEGLLRKFFVPFLGFNVRRGISRLKKSFVKNAVE
jgi:hypothetical protein